MKTYFLPIASGSSGNAGLYVSGDSVLLVDAGTNTKTIKSALATVGLELNHITDILITHTHSDHISALPVLLKNTGARLMISQNALTELDSDISHRAESFEYGKAFVCGQVQVTPFETLHDSYGSVGFRIDDGANSFAYCTDLGRVTPEVRKGVDGVHTLYIESNHDIEMLKNGRYPRFLKDRILSDLGHLSNQDAGALVLKLCQDKLRCAVLAHLSRDNNKPETALLEVETQLYKGGVGSGVTVRVAQPRNKLPPVVIC